MDFELNNDNDNDMVVRKIDGYLYRVFPSTAFEVDQ